MNDRFKFRVPVFYDGKFKAFKKYSLCNGVVIWKEPETIGELWIEDELKRNNPHLSLGHDEQCTGLKDKNGKLIYEGDIVKTEWFDEKTIYQVVWDEKMACFYFDSKDMLYLFDDLPAEVTEIIGNIDENPELLEVQDEKIQN